MVTVCDTYIVMNKERFKKKLKYGDIYCEKHNHVMPLLTFIDGTKYQSINCEECIAEIVNGEIENEAKENNGNTE